MNSVEGIKMCENLAESHNSYLKWLHEFKLIPDDELLKYYSIFEGQTLRLCAQFYSDDIQDTYIKLQRLSLQTTINKLKFQLSSGSVGPSESASLLKQFHHVCENLLLSYRMKEKFDEALDTLRTAHSFLARFDLDTVELEWLVTNWCKIKRDLWKAKSTVHQKTTVADYLDLKESLVDKFLIQEIRTYNSFKFE